MHFDNSFELSSYFVTEFEWSSLWPTANHQEALTDSIFQPEVIVANFPLCTTNHRNSFYGPVQNSLQSSGKQNIRPNAQLYFNLKINYDLEIHSLCCIFLENFVPFNEIFTSSGGDFLDSSEKYIFISNWNFVCPCIRLQDPYESNIIRNTFRTLENVDSPKYSTIETPSSSFPYQEFKKAHKSIQNRIPPPKREEPTIYSSNNSVNFPLNLVIVPQRDNHTPAIKILQPDKDLNTARSNIPFVSLPNTLNSTPVNKNPAVLETGKNAKQNLLDSVINLHQIPGSVSDDQYEKSEAFAVKAINIPEQKPAGNLNVMCPSPTVFPNTDLTLVENTLVCITNEMTLLEDKDLTAEAVAGSSSWGWATNVKQSLNTIANEQLSTESTADTCNGNTTLKYISNHSPVTKQTKEPDVQLVQLLQADALTENGLENDNLIATETESDGGKRKSPFSWFKRYPLKKSIVLRYLFRGIGYRLASYAIKPKRIAAEGFPVKRKIISIRFKNRFGIRTKVDPFDTSIFSRKIVQGNLFKKRSAKQNLKKHKAFENSEVHDFLPVKLLKHNRVIPLPKSQKK